MAKTTLCEFFECSSIIQYDAEGNILWTLDLPNTDVASQSSYIYNDTLYVAGNYSPGEGITAIHKISMDGNLLGTYLYTDPNKNIKRSLILELNKFRDKFVITGQGFVNEESKSMILSVNCSTMELDTIFTDSYSGYSSILDTDIGPDSFMTCFIRENLKQIPDKVRRIVKYNDAFRPVWTYTSDTLYTNISYPNGIVLNDGRVVYVDYKPTWPTGLDGLKCLDTLTKQTSWRFDYPFQPSWGRKLFTVKQLRNGDIICTGKYTTKATTPRIEGSPYMMRIDTRGNMLWERAYVEIAPDGKDKGGSLWDVLELDNGDLMAVGYVTNNHKWDPLIIRTDADGCIDQGQANCPQVQIIDLMSGAVDVIGEDVVSIYPNPSYEGNVTIDIPDYNHKNEYSYSVQSTSGGCINKGTLSQKVSELSLNIPSGLYFVTLLKNGKPMLNQKWVVIR